MKNISISPQMQVIYQRLLNVKHMTATEIAHGLKILPNAVYRVLDRLETAGFVVQEPGYPFRYRAVPIEESVERFLATERQWFTNAFGHQKAGGEPLTVSFIQKREESLARFGRDLAHAQKEVKLLVSGLEIPAEAMLAYKNACDRGVKVQILVQKSGILNSALIDSWKKIGAAVRTCASIETRLLIIDSKIAYLLSYQERNPEQALGVRFAYPPIVVLLKENFLMRWKSTS